MEENCGTELIVQRSLILINKINLSLFFREGRGEAMKIIVNIARVIVGILFIFSGLVKANDPLGLSYKMQEFFDVWGSYQSLHGLMQWLNNYALTFSIITITLEIVVGVAILLGWAKRFIAWLLLLLIIFFTFLTGYAVLSGKIRTCGCFGDCIPITAMQSFIKDLILFVLILIIFFGIRYIQPLFKGTIDFVLLIFSVALVLGLQWHVLIHLPFVDCLPFKKGNNLLELRKMPADAVPDKMDFTFVYKKNGEEKEFKKDQLPDSTWTFVSRKDILIERGKNNEPPIKDFFLYTVSGTDTTESLLNQPGFYYLFFIKDAKEGKEHWVKEFSSIYNFARQTHRPMYVITSQATTAQQYFNEKNNFDLPILSCDATALKTAARTDPALYLMKGPVVQQKWGWKDFDKAMQ